MQIDLYCCMVFPAIGTADRRPVYSRRGVHRTGIDGGVLGGSHTDATGLHLAACDLRYMQ